MKNKHQIMEDMKTMGNEYINNLKNQIKAEDADFLRTLLNIPEHPFTDLTTEMFQTYLKKNADYGDSFSKSLNENGLVAAKVRLEDKFNRFGNLIKNDQQVSDESKEDTLLDMANYAIMTVMWMREKNPTFNQGFTVEEFNLWLDSLEGGYASKEVAATDMLKSMGYPPLTSNTGADVDGDIAIEPGAEWYVRAKKELEEFEKTRKRKITEGSVVKIREGRRAGMYDEVTRVLESPRRYNLKQEKYTIYYFPEELELIK